MPRPDVAAVVVSREEIRRRTAELAREIAVATAGSRLTIVPVLAGAATFAEGLLAHLPMKCDVAPVGVRSYRLRRSGRIEFTQPLTVDLSGRDVLIVDDILDTGQTLSAVAEAVAGHAPAAVRTCVLLRKPAAAGGERPAVHFVGFDIPDLFVVGYGLDLDGRYRDWPEVVVLKGDDDAVG